MEKLRVKMSAPACLILLLAVFLPAAAFAGDSLPIVYVHGAARLGSPVRDPGHALGKQRLPEPGHRH